MGSEARARIGLVFLLCVTLFSFSQVYGTGDYPGPSLLAMAFAMGIAIGLRRLGAGTLTTFLVSAICLLGYLSWIFKGGKAWFLIPTPASIAGLVDSISAALEKASIDYAPVPVRPGYVILTAAGIWILATLGEVATFRWRRPLIASLGCVALFTFVLVVGTHEGAWLLVTLFLAALFTYWSLEAAHRLRSWGSWVSTWRDGTSEPPVLTHSTARRMGASSVLIALVAPLFMPSIGDALLSWKSGRGDGPGGGGVGGQINPLVSIAPRIIEQSDAEMFTVVTDSPTRWKLLTLERYDGAGNWDQDSHTIEQAGNGSIAVFGPSADPPKTVERLSKIDIESLQGSALPVRFPAGDVVVTSGAATTDLMMKPENGDVSLDGGLTPDVAYEVRSEVPDVTYHELLRAEVGAVTDDVYTEIGEPLDPRVESLLDDWTAGADTPFEKLIQIEGQLQGPQFAYDLDIGRQQIDDPPADPLAHFLLESRRGYCQQYASAFAVLARRLGYPTRLAVGFLPGARQTVPIAREDVPLPEGEREYSVTGLDAHAWPEVYFEDYGWIAFEPTQRSDVATNDLTWLSPISPTDRPRTDTLDPNRFREGNPREEELGRAGRAGAGNAGGSELDPQGGVSDAWKKPFTRLALGVGAIIVLFLIAVPSLKSWRVNNRYRRAAGPAGRAAAAFAEFQQEASELASPRRRAESAPAYARRVTSLKKLDGTSAARLAWIYELAEYGSHGVENNIADEARRIAHSLRSALWQSSGWWQRLNRLFSTAGLRSG